MDAERLQTEVDRLTELNRQHETTIDQYTATIDRHTATISQHTATIDQLHQEIADKEQQLASLRHQVKQLLRQVRGSRQERIDPDQLLLFSMEELKQLADELREEADDRVPEEDDPQDQDSGDDKGQGKRRGRRTLPKHIRREIIRHELAPDELPCPCCGKDRVEFAVTSSEQLEFVPGYWKAIQHDRVTYRCTTCEEHIITADKPPQPIEKGVPGPGLCAYVVLSKFGDHLPLYREEDIFSRLGWPLRRSTLCGWLQTLAGLSMPLVMRMKHLILQSMVIHTDDTKIKMLQPGLGVTREAKFWPYLGDWLHPYAVYDFTVDRSRDGPMKFLEGFEGYLQADAYAGYDGVYAGHQVHEVACWVHARRYWHQARDSDSARANVALGFIARLSQIEEQLREAYPYRNLQGERDFSAIAAARQQHSVPILDEFGDWMERESDSGKLLPKSPVRAAFTYTQNQWEALRQYTVEGYLSFENNAAERLVKFPAIGRKNYLFVGGESGGRNAGAFYSLVSSAKANGVEPFAWLRDVFTRLPFHRDGEAFAQVADGASVTSDQLDALLPDIWLRSHPEHVWTIDEVRRAERVQKDKRRRLRRKRRR